MLPIPIVRLGGESLRVVLGAFVVVLSNGDSKFWHIGFEQDGGVSVLDLDITISKSGGSPQKSV